MRKTTDRKRVRVIVVDDGSPDRAPASACARLRGARVELLPENGGFAGAVNRGLDAGAAPATTSWCSTPTWSRERGLARAAAVHRPTASDGSGSSARSCSTPTGGSSRRAPTATSARPEWFDHRYRFKDATHPEANIIAPVLGTTGACMYVKRAALDAIGPLRRGLRHGLRGHGLLPARLGGGLAHLLRAARLAAAPRVADAPDRAGRARARLAALLLAALGRVLRRARRAHAGRAACGSST